MKTWAEGAGAEAEAEQARLVKDAAMEASGV